MPSPANILVCLGLALLLAATAVCRTAREPFESAAAATPQPHLPPWPLDLVRRFNQFQYAAANSPDRGGPSAARAVYDIPALQRIVPAADVETLLSTGLWPWDADLRMAYASAVARNEFVSADPDAAVLRARQTVPAAAAKLRLFFGDSDEGQFVLHGLQRRRRRQEPDGPQHLLPPDTIQCESASDASGFVPVLTEYRGYDPTRAAFVTQKSALTPSRNPCAILN
jgi:hypothetical protein